MCAVSLEAAWDEAVPDEPRWVEIRSMLLSGRARIFGDPSGAVVVDTERSVAGVVGLPSEDVLDAGITSLSEQSEILVMEESLDHMRAFLPLAEPTRAIIHRLATPLSDQQVGDVEISPVDDRLLSALPDALVHEVEGAHTVAVRRKGALVVAVCSAWWPTETLWDVGVDTLEGHRRQGHARAAFTALARHMDVVHGIEPVWGATVENHASLRMAESLGFVAESSLWLFGNSR